jgi:preprotein translocase subunit SecF
LDIPNPYLGRDYRVYMVVPVVLMLIAAYFVLVNPGLEQGIDLKGGLLITLQTSKPVDTPALQAALLKYSSSVEIRTISTPSGGTGVEIELENNPELEQAEADVKSLLELDRTLTDAELAIAAQNGTGDTSRVTALKTQIFAQSKAILASIRSQAVVGDDAHETVQVVADEQAAAKAAYRETLISEVKRLTGTSDLSFREVGSSLSKFFLTKTREIVLLAFALSAIVIFLVFRSIAPSIAVIFGAVADVTITMGVMALVGIPLTLATIATLLMLIGFSLDTDVMLTMRVIKRKEGTAEERAFEALKTGFLMNLTTIGAFGALYIVAQWLQISTYAQIGSVALIGGFADFIATWMFNAALILWWHNRGLKK